jgi:peptidoglycan/LPS O-acetylase OafA/YrhL
MAFSRITSNGKLIPEIDGLRCVAILSVVAFHIHEILVGRAGITHTRLIDIVLTNGQRGVPLFFVISGFILGRPFAMHYICGTPAPKLKQYFWRRVTRLEPPYLIAILTVFFGLMAFSSSRGIGHLLASLVYSHNLLYGAPNPFYGLAWSLEIEIQFYCLIPLLATVYTVPRLWRRALLLSFMFAGLFHWMPMAARVNLSILGWIQCFAAGLLLADLYTDGWHQRQHWSFDLLSLALWPLVFLVTDSLAWVLIPFLALILYVAAFRSLVFQRLFNIPAVVTIGGMCYTIYLVHYPVLSAVQKLSRNPTVVTILSSVAITFASLVFFVLIERPCMRKEWPQRLVALLHRPSVPLISADSERS